MSCLGLGRCHALVAFLTIIFFSLAPSLLQAGDAVAWLSSQSQPDGGYQGADDLATPYQSTAETIRTFQVFGENAQPGIPAARERLATEPHRSTEYLARRVIIEAQAGAPVAGLAAEIKGRVNPDGGFGELEGYSTTVLDSVFALQALAVTGQGTGETVAYLVGYLQSRQFPDGSWSDGENEPSIYLTALASDALQQVKHLYLVDETIDNANAYLLSRRDGTGAVGETFETALAVLAVAPAVFDKTLYQDLVARLRASQSADGSWNGDVYTTALAARALYVADTVTGPDPVLGTVAGLITDGLSGHPLEGVTITLQGDGFLSASTDANGLYAITGVTPGQVNLSAALDGYVTVNASAAVLADQTLNFSLSLVKDPTPVAIQLTGIVVSATDHAPLANATVQVQSTAYGTRTDQRGTFSLGGIPAGSITVAVSLNGYSEMAFAVSAPSGGGVDLGQIELAPQPSEPPQTTTGSLSGIVTDAATGQALRGVQISVSGADARAAFSDADGRFLFEDLSPGDIDIMASLDGYHAASGSGAIVAGATLTFTVSMVKETAPALVTVKGLVVDADTLMPLQGVMVDAGTLFQTQSGGDGRFALTVMPAGALTLDLSKDGYVGVQYQAAAPAGGLIDLGEVRLAPDVPITLNQPPVILSKPPASVTAGDLYQYQLTASDPEGGALLYGVSNGPGGLEIETATGLIRWIPTAEHGGEQTFDVVVSDPQGAVAIQPVAVSVQVGSYPSYVVTDVETLNGLTQDALVPSSYALGRYVSGGRSGTWRASSANGCGFGYYSGTNDRAAAANALDFWSVGSGYGSDAVWDLEQPYSTVTVFPFIDHGPFPQEGIEYTVWGSDDPNAPFPDGWTLGTLVTIYGQGWADNKAACSGYSTNIDDDAGLYTFGASAFRYIRLKADNSITIFDAPAHTSYRSSGDDGTQAGWQSIESEIDGVAGMVCDVKPIAEAGDDIVGVVNDTIQLDGFGSQGNIRTYGWDLDGDSEIDLSGVTPTHVFTAGFDRDVTLLVVDDWGCVGTDTVHVSVDLNLPLPDLTVTSVATPDLSTDLQTLQASGVVEVVVENIGKAPATEPALVTVFEDLNGNGVFDPAADNPLGAATLPSGLEPGGQVSPRMAVNGQLAFRDSHVYAMVDSDRRIDEAREDNNVSSTAAACRIVPPPIGPLELRAKWQWNGLADDPSLKHVVSTVVVGQLSDDNGDGKISPLDTPDLVFGAGNAGWNASRSALVALSGDDGHELWHRADIRASQRGAVALGDIDGDGVVEIVVVDRNRARLMALENHGTLKWSVSTGQSQGDDRADAPVVVDLWGDGDPEIVHGRYVYSSSGNLLWVGQRDEAGLDYARWFGTVPIAADVDMDGISEIIAGRTLYSAAGNVIWHRGNLVGDGYNAIGNFDDDEFPEIVLVARGKVYLLEHTGETIWGPVSLPYGGNRGGPPTVADFDGDGEPEIGVAGAYRYLVLEANGAIKWISNTQDNSSAATGSSLFDFQDDGKAEVLYADEQYFRIYDGETGSVLTQIRNRSTTTIEYPVVVDLDNDGSAEVVVPSSNWAQAGVRVFESADAQWPATRNLWNQHAYDIGNVNDDGTIPTHAAYPWLTHNSFRLNTFVDRNPLAVPDLSASRLQVLDNGPSVPASLSVRIGNAGDGPVSSEVLVAFYQGDPLAGGILLGTVALTDLGAGQYRDVALDNVTSLSSTEDIYVIADDDNRLIECDETNNSVMLPVRTQSNAGAITVGTDAPVYGRQSPVLLQGAITNTSALPGEYQAQLQVEDSDGVVLASFAAHPVGPLLGGGVAQFTESWQTGGVIAGVYQVRGRLLDPEGKLVDEALSPFEIASSADGASALSLRSTTDRPVYHTTDQVLIDNLVGNLSGNTLVKGAWLSVQVLDPDGFQVVSQPLPLSELLPRAQRSLRMTLPLSAAPQGVYRADGRVLDSDDQVLASDSTSFQVQEDLSLALVGSIVADPPSLYQGEVQTCRYSLESHSTQDLSDLVLRRVIADLDTSTEVAAETTTLDLPAGATTPALIDESDSAYLDLGVYACVLQAQIQGTWATLGKALFEVLEPPIKIEATLADGDHGRLLVLLDDPATTPSGSADDPLGPNRDPDLATQRRYLEALLQGAGWSYTIVTRPEDFAAELRSGTYATYLLLSEPAKLDESAQKALREAVYRGEGLVGAGGHDRRQGRLDDALGINFIGKLPHAGGLSLADSPLHAAQSAPLGLTDRVLRAQTEGATVLGRFTDTYGAVTEEPAVTEFVFGQGRSVYLGLDLLAEAALAGGDNLYGQLILAALERVRSATVAPLPGRAYPVALTLLNQGIATPGRAILTLPPDVRVAGPGEVTPQDNTLIWPFNLAEGETVRLTAWLVLAEGDLHLDALIQTGTDPNFVDHVSTALDLAAQSEASVTGALNAVIRLNDEKYKQVEKYLRWAEEDWVAARYASSADALIRAADALARIDDAHSGAIRLQVAKALRAVSRNI